jgi:DNA-binding SARP family transcriptional activator
MLGTTELVAADGRPAEAILAQPKRLALLAYLCVARPAGFRRRDQLLALFWPELDEARARSALSQALHKLRQSLGQDVVLTRGPDEVGANPQRLTTDVTDLYRALADGRPHEALDLYRGDLLPGFAIRESPEFDQWLENERRTLRDRVAAAAWEAVEGAQAGGRAADAGRLARRAVELAPYDEAGVRRCIGLLAQAGDPAGAVRCYDEFAERLRRDLELTPAPETTALLTGLKARRPEPTSVATPAARTDAEVPTAAVPRVIPHAVRGGRPQWPWVAALAGVLVLVVLWARLPRREAADIAVTTDRVLVLPFAVRGDSTLAFLAEGMVDLLSTSVDGMARIQAVDPHAVLARLSPPDTGAATVERGVAVARRLGASAFVIGEVTAIADRLDVRAVLYDSVGRHETVLATQARTRAALPEAVDDLARQLVASRLPGPAQRLSRLATLATDSLDALRAYLAGEQHLRRGEFGPAVDAFRAAVTVDSLFSLAWFRLGVALEWVQASSPERRVTLERAVAMSDRLTERDAMLVRAYHAYAFGSLEEAEALYRRLVTLYPEDVEAWYGLADALFHAGPIRGRPIAQAEPAFQRLLALQPDHVEGRLHLARLLALRADPEARAALDTLVTATLPMMAAGQGQAVRLRVLRAFALGDTAGLRVLEPEITALPELDVWEIAAQIATMTGDLDGAAVLLRSLTPAWRPAVWRAIGHMALAHVALSEGRWVGARAELDALARIDPTLAMLVRVFASAQPWLPLSAAERDSARRLVADWDPTTPPTPVLLRIYPFVVAIGPALRFADLGVLAALAGDRAAADRYADSLTALAPLATPFPGDWELPTSTRAAIAFVRGEPGTALTALETLQRRPQITAYPRMFVLTHGFERWVRAEALRASGRLREALDWYGAFTSYLVLMDTPYEAPAWLRQAGIHEDLGERQAARAAYARVLERWGNADARFAPMLREARTGLARTSGRP